MKAAILDEYGGTPRYGDFEQPATADGAVVADVMVAALNPSDINRSRGPGKFFVDPPPLPYVVGREGVAELPDGRRVYFGSTLGRFGSMAERALIDSSSMVDLPAGLDDGIAASLGTSGTGWLALEWRAGLTPGETVVILGATSAVGQIAVQAAKLQGAGRVVAVGRNPDALRRSLRQGADAAIRIGDAEDLGAAVAEACDGGYDVMLDPLWGEPLGQVLKAANPGARIVQIGQSAGATANLASAPVRGKMLSLLGYTNFNPLVPADRRAAAFRAMLDHAAAGRLVVEVERVPLAEAASAWERQKDSPGTKLVLVP